MSTGCYIIGENVITTSLNISSVNNFAATDDYIFSFKEACKKLEVKLECLIIVDCLRKNELEDTNAIYQIAKEYANFVYIITPIVALLQNVLSSDAFSTTVFPSTNTVIAFIASSFGVISCVLEKIDNLFYPVNIKTLSSNNLKNEFFLHLLNPAFCLHDITLHSGILSDLTQVFPNLIKKSYKSSREALIFGGLKRAQCIVESGKHFEIINFTPGIIVGQEVVLETGRTFPVTVHYSSPLVLFHDIRYCQTIRRMTLKIKNDYWNVLKLKDKILRQDNCPINYIISYNECGLLTIEKSNAAPIPSFMGGINFTENFAIWSSTIQILAVYNFQKNSLELSKINCLFENPKSNDEFEKLEKFVKNVAEEFKTLTIIFDGKFEYRINHSNIYIIPSYIALLEYCIRYFQPINEKLIIFITTKTDSKFYVLTATSITSYTVVYIGTIKLTETFITKNFLRGYNNIGIFHLTENDPKTNILFFDKMVSKMIKRLKISDLDTVLLHGSLMYSTMESQPLRIVPHINYGYLNSPVSIENHKINTVAPSKYYEIEAVLYSILPEIGLMDYKLFWGDLIAILIQKKKNIYAYIFAEINQQKYFLHDFITVNVEAKLTLHLLKNPSQILIFKTQKSINLKMNFGNVKATFVDGRILKNAVKNYLKAVENQNLNIYRTPEYCNAIKAAVKNEIFDKIILQTYHSMIIECNENGCRIILEEPDIYLTFKEDEEWIPMYISFLHKTPKIGKKALQHLQNSSEFVIHDFADFLEATSAKHPPYNPKWNFKIVELDKTKNPKLGFKINTFHGYRIITPEMALSIYLQNLLLLYEKYIKKEITKINFHSIKKWFTKNQRNCIETTVANLLKKEIVYKKF